jgi:hypothetical protein
VSDERDEKVRKFGEALEAWVEATGARENAGKVEAVPSEREKVLAEVVRLRDALRRYGEHERSCAVWKAVWHVSDPLPPEPLACDCGLADALREDT